MKPSNLNAVEQTVRSHIFEFQRELDWTHNDCIGDRFLSHCSAQARKPVEPRRPLLYNIVSHIVTRRIHFEVVGRWMLIPYGQAFLNQCHVGIMRLYDAEPLWPLILQMECSSCLAMIRHRSHWEV